MRAPIVYLWIVLWAGVCGGAGQSLPGTQPLTATGDLSAQMVAGIDRFLSGEIERSVKLRSNYWQRDFSSREAYARSVEPNRERFGRCIGAVDARVPARELELQETSRRPAKIAEAERYVVYAVRWPVFEGVFGEGLWLRPKATSGAFVVAIPDADQTPEMLAGLAPGLGPESQMARRLAEQGCEVIVPALVNRQDTWSGSGRLKRWTNQPHREWIYRQAYEMGRHIIGYEVQKVLAAVDWWVDGEDGKRKGRIGVAGYAEGGLIACYSAAVDRRIDAALVSGYFEGRERVWEEPIYRNVFGLLREFGDAEIASLIAPRTLIVEHSAAPRIEGPPAAREGRQGAAPGKWGTPEFSRVESEVRRANALVRPLRWEIELVHGNEGITVGPGSAYAVAFFLKALGITAALKTGEAPARPADGGVEVEARQRRQVFELEQFTQGLLRESERVREAFFWQGLRNADSNRWEAACQAQRQYLWDEVIGRFENALLPANARSRKIYDRTGWTGHEVMLDVFPDVFAWGYLLVPNDLKPGERRPVVVCQHGLEGLPEDVVNEEPKSRGFGAYQGYAARLAERGFVVYAPHNPYRGGDKFRVLQRKANPLKKSLFSIILAQHQRTLELLGGLPFVDPARIGFYGLSYGGKTAMRVPALLDGYCLSICSADFNEWIKKNVTTESGYSYLFTGEYEMPEFNLGQTFNYAEMAALIAPRPFMVERGHLDGVAPDEWVAFEYAKVRRLYAKLGLPGRTEIEFFNGPHTIHGEGTFKFLQRHLNWPERP